MAPCAVGVVAHAVFNHLGMVVAVLSAEATGHHGRFEHDSVLLVDFRGHAAHDVEGPVIAQLPLADIVGQLRVSETGCAVKVRRPGLLVVIEPHGHAVFVAHDEILKDVGHDLNSGFRPPIGLPLEYRDCMCGCQADKHG